MSLFSFVAKQVTPYIATSDSIVNAVDKVKDKIDESENNRVEKLYRKEPGTELLVFFPHHPVDSLVDMFDIYDENRVLRYTAKDKLLSKKRHLEVFEANGNRIGLLKEKLFAYRGLISFESSPVNFSVEIYGKKLGMIKSKGGILNRKFVIGFNGWSVKGNVLSGNYSVVKGKEEIAKVARSYGNYALTFYEKQNELVLLMIVIALYSDAASEKKDVVTRKMGSVKRKRRIKKQNKKPWLHWL